MFINSHTILEAALGFGLFGCLYDPFFPVQYERLVMAKMIRVSLLVIAVTSCYGGGFESFHAGVTNFVAYINSHLKARVVTFQSKVHDTHDVELPVRIRFAHHSHELSRPLNVEG